MLEGMRVRTCMPCHSLELGKKTSNSLCWDPKEGVEVCEELRLHEWDLPRVRTRIQSGVFEIHHRRDKCL